jgi:hypothetical protein
MVTLWASGAMLVRTTETLPAFAANEVFSYFNWPSGFASRLKGGATLAGAGAVDAAVVGLVGGTGRTFGVDWAGLGAGVEDVAAPDAAALEVAGLTDWLAAVDAVALGARTDLVAVLDVAGMVLDVAGTVLDGVGVLARLAGVDVEELLMLDDSPQPASAIKPTASVSDVSLDIERGVAKSGALNLMLRSLVAVTRRGTGRRRGWRGGGSRRGRADAAGRGQRMPSSAEAVDALTVRVPLGVVARVVVERQPAERYL